MASNRIKLHFTRASIDRRNRHQLSYRGGGGGGHYVRHPVRFWSELQNFYKNFFHSLRPTAHRKSPAETKIAHRKTKLPAKENKLPWEMLMSPHDVMRFCGD